jgi:hypothetical protein
LVSSVGFLSGASRSTARCDWRASCAEVTHGDDLRIRVERLAVRVEAWEPCSLTCLREKPIKIIAKVVSHGRYVTFRLARIVVSREMSLIS